MNSLIVYTVLLTITTMVVMAVDEKANCKCWEDFAPEKDENGWYCRGKKNHRIFGCNEEKPPVCKCTEKGKEVTLDIGEVNCANADRKFDDINCAPKDEWEAYLTKHPEKRLYY